MEKEDVLIGDIRVTALADEGSYSFEWEDENKKIITLADNCKFTEVPEHVRKVIEAHDLRIVESDLAQDTEETSESKKDKIISRGKDSLFSNPDSKSSGINTIEDTQSEDTQSEESDKSEQEQQLISFTVRMSDPEERESVVKELKNSNQEAAKELQLTGPYKVTYDVSGSNIELVSVEDVGIGSSVK